MTPLNTDDWRALRALNGYRWVVAIAAAVLFYTGLAAQVFEIISPLLFGTACIVYLQICVAAAWASYRRQPPLHWQITALIASDTAFVLSLVLASGGVPGGLAVLLFAPIAGTGLMVRPRKAALFAALASLGLLAAEGWRHLSATGDAAAWVQTGILGALLFVAAIVASIVARRARTNAELAARHKSELDDLASLNERIIQQMSIGLLVIDEQRHVRVINRAARDMLDYHGEIAGRPLSATVPMLSWALQAWMLSPNLSSEPFNIGPRRFVARFNRIGADSQAPVLVFLEDARRVSEQAQQIKLASLGRLTASIAHEIRNPLSAISHAGQLLEESERLGHDEQHLLAIMHRHTQRIDAIVQSILGLSRRGQTLAARLELGPWLERFVADYGSPRGQRPRLVLATRPAGMVVQADPNQLRQVLNNLCENAEAHAATPDLALKIAFTAGETSGGQPYLDVADNGPGISAAVAENLMEPFFTTSHDGTGLGLYIARELCESNFARLALVDSEHGARFRITFARPDALEAEMAGLTTEVDAMPGAGVVRTTTGQ